MPITAEQADQAKDIILKTLDAHHKGQLPYRDVWTKPAVEDFEGLAFLDVWIIYDGKPGSLDPGMLNSYDSFLYQTLIDAGIRALPSVSYIPESDIAKMDEPWLSEKWIG